MTSKEYYEATQKQRAKEREIRKTKAEIAAGERAGLDMTQQRLTLGRQQAQLNAFTKQTGLVRQPAREKAYGIGAQPRALFGAPKIKSPMAVASPIAFVPNLENLHANAMKVIPKTGFTDVTIHGNGISFFFSETSNHPVSASSLSSLLGKVPSYQGGSIRLMSCSAGAYNDGVAQQVANILGVDVLAPTDSLWITETGDMIISDTKFNAERWIATGSWKLFKPK